MSFTKRKLIVNSILSVGLFISAFYSVANVRAQDAVELEELIDFSIDLDDLPPQPTQSEVLEMDIVPNVPDTQFEVLDTDDAKTKLVEVATPEKVENVVVSPEAVTKIEKPSAPLDEAVKKPVVETAIADPLGIEAQLEAKNKHSGTYYDADSFVPSAELTKAAGPREVDPKYEPGSRFVVVTRGAGPNSRAARLVAVQRALKLGRYTSALELSEKLYKKSPKNKQVLMGLAVSQQYSGFTESAVATYEELLAIDPNNADAMINMLGLIKQRYPEQAYQKLKKLWSKNSLNSGLAAQLGLTSASMGRFEDALHYLGMAVSIDPDNASHYYNMAVVSDQAGAYKDALELYQKSLEVDVAHGGRQSIPRDKIYDRLARLRRL